MCSHGRSQPVADWNCAVLMPSMQCRPRRAPDCAALHPGYVTGSALKPLSPRERGGGEGRAHAGACERRDLSDLDFVVTDEVRKRLAHDVFVPSPLPLSRWERGSSASGELWSH